MAAVLLKMRKEDKTAKRRIGPAIRDLLCLRCMTVILYPEPRHYLFQLAEFSSYLLIESPM
jgi:hypothetical protein